MHLAIFHTELLPLIFTTIAMAALEYTGLHKYQWWVFWIFLITIIVMSYNYVSSVIKQIS